MASSPTSYRQLPTPPSDKTYSASSSDIKHVLGEDLPSTNTPPPNFIQDLFSIIKEVRKILLSTSSPLPRRTGTDWNGLTKDILTMTTVSQPNNYSSFPAEWSQQAPLQKGTCLGQLADSQVSPQSCPARLADLAQSSLNTY